MNKEELIHMHTLMVLIKNYLEQRGKGDFSKYNSLHIGPTYVHKSKYEHKNAIFTLGKEILSAILDNSNMIVNDQNMIVNDQSDQN